MTFPLGKLTQRTEVLTESRLRSGLFLSSALLALSMFMISGLPVRATDFSRAQKLYVPPSQIDRRVDFSSMRESISIPSALRKTATITKTVNLSKSKSGSKGKKKGKTSATPAPAASTASRSAGSNPIAKMNQAADQLIKQGKLDEAQRVLSKINEISPDQATAKKLVNLDLQRAKQFMGKNDFQNALSASRHALSVDPNNADAQNILSQLYQKAGVNPASIEDRLKTAATLYTQGQYQESEAEYRASLAIQPTAQAHVGLGKIAERFSGPAAAKAEYETALKVDPKSALAHRELGLLYQNSGDIVGANSALSQALSLDPHDDVASKSLVSLWQNQVSKLPNANSHLGLARAYQLSGDLPAAQAEYKQAVHLDPNHPFLPTARQSFKNALAKQGAEKNIRDAQILESQGRLTDAFQKVNQAVSQHPRNMDNRLYQGALLERLGQAEQARQVYTAILAEDPNNLTANQRLQVLPAAVAAAPNTTGILAGNQPAGFPGTKLGTLLPFDTPVTTGGLAATDMPQLVASGDHVAVISNFMGSVRDQMLTQKQQWQSVEDVAHRALKNIGTPAAAPTTGIAALPPALGATNDDYISKILNSPVGSSLPPKTIDTPAAVLTAKPALAFNGAVEQTQPVLMNAPTPAPALVSKPPTVIPTSGVSSLVSAPPIAPPFTPVAVASAPPLMSQTAAAIPTGGMISSTQGIIGPATNLPPLLSSGSAAAMLPASATQAILRPPIQSPASIQAELRPSIQSPSSPTPPAAPNPIRFELVQIQPTLSNVQLKVVLKNDSNAPLNIPNNVKAIIKYPIGREAEVKIDFDARTVQPHGIMNGIIRVPFNKVDPAADLVLRNLLPPGSGNSELHLSRSLAQL